MSDDGQEPDQPHLDRWHRITPLDDQLDDKPRDGLTKNDHFRDLIDAARLRGLALPQGW